MNRTAIPRRGFLSIAVFLAALPTLGLAEPAVMDAPTALGKVQDGEIVLLDIRSREEWKETGLAEGAWPVSLHERDFAQRLSAVLEANPADTVALICATGGRSAHVQNILQKNGIAGVIDVSEGMLGNARGPGWIARGLPVVPLQDALAAYHAAFPD